MLKATHENKKGRIMTKIHVSALTSIILTSAVMVSQVNADDIVSPANIISADSTAPTLVLSSGTTPLWDMAGGSNNYRIFDYANGNAVVRITASSNNSDSINVGLNGGIGLANNAVYINRAAKQMGIGTDTPEDALHIGGTGNIILETNDISKWRIGTRPEGGIILQDMISGNNPFIIDANAPTDSLNIADNGNVGFGTADPSEAVDVVGTDAAARFKLTSVTNTGNEAAQFIQRRARSESGSPAAVQNSDVIGFFSFRGWNGTGWTGTKAGISVTATEDWSETQNGNLVTISHTPNGSNTLTAALQIKGQADVYIPNGNLYVKGSKMNVPDYVFKDDYKLMPLDELKAYVEKNNHLPGVASADEVGKAGVVNLSGLQMTLLEKVEELTLYTLQQEEKIARLEAMQTRLTKLESLLTNLALDTSNSNKEKVSMK